MTSRLLFLLILLTGILSCKEKQKNVKREVFGVKRADLDSTISPAADLFRYANGRWLSKSSIPAEYGRWGSFDELGEHNTAILLSTLKKAAESKEFLDGTDQRKVSDFFETGMDSLLAEKTGVNPLKPAFDRLDKVTSREELTALMVESCLAATPSFFSFTVGPDMKDNNKMAVYLGSGGLGLPDRDFYLMQDVKSVETRSKYRSHVARLLSLSGWDAGRSSRIAERIVLLETDLARATLTKEEKRDPVRVYNKVSVKDLSSLAHVVQWTDYFKALNVNEDSIIVEEPAFLKGFDRIVVTYPLDDIKAYLRWAQLRMAAPYLNNACVVESFAFNKKYLQGIDRMLPRWKRVLSTTDNLMGEALGKLYVADVFPEDAKVKAKEMVDNIRLSFADRIKRLTWMSDSTKANALKKLGAMTVKIGYPDKWRNYSGLSINRGDKSSYLENVGNAYRYQVRQLIDKLGKPVDKSVWTISPQTVNAYYNPQFNEIVFPAGILQPPFYDYRADEAVNYGGIGGGIGHEISHGFDDQGSQYDADGNLRNWWRPEDLQQFKARGKALEDQFNKFQPLPGLFVQGKFTLGENIGDLGGLNVAFDGLHRYWREHNISPEMIDGLTGDQRFFLSWATIWRSRFRDEALRTYILTNPHAPGQYRANGPPSNMPVFYEAFGVKPGDPMYRDQKDRVEIW